jgi:hypothetical protein
LLSKKSGLKPRLLRRKVFEAGHKSPLQKHPPASCLLPTAFVKRLRQNSKNLSSKCNGNTIIQSPDELSEDEDERSKLIKKEIPIAWRREIFDNPSKSGMSQFHKKTIKIE